MLLLHMSGSRSMYEKETRGQGDLSMIRDESGIL
jgi:hypothetical protein